MDYGNLKQFLTKNCRPSVHFWVNFSDLLDPSNQTVLNTNVESI